MKKTLVIVFVVVALIAMTYWADRHWPAARTAGGVAKADPAAGVAPDMSLEDLQGREVSLAQFRGQVVLVNFWATWCEPCRIEIPWLIEAQQKYGSRGFTVIGIAMDDEGKKVVEPFVQKEQFEVNGQKASMNYPILLGNDAVADRFGGLIGFPTSMLYSRDGKRVRLFMGLLNHDELMKAIEAQL